MLKSVNYYFFIYLCGGSTGVCRNVLEGVTLRSGLLLKEMIEQVSEFNSAVLKNEP